MSLYDCNYKLVRVKFKGKVSPDSDFESRVCKLQIYAQVLKTENEKAACRYLLKPPSSKQNLRCELSAQRFLETIANKHRYERKNEYNNFDFLTPPCWDRMSLVTTKTYLERL